MHATLICTVYCIDASNHYTVYLYIQEAGKRKITLDETRDIVGTLTSVIERAMRSGKVGPELLDPALLSSILKELAMQFFW